MDLVMRLGGVYQNRRRPTEGRAPVRSRRDGTCDAIAWCCSRLPQFARIVGFWSVNQRGERIARPSEVHEGGRR